MACNDVRGAAREHALNGSQIKRRVNELSMMLKLGRITRFDSLWRVYASCSDNQRSTSWSGTTRRNAATPP